MGQVQWVSRADRFVSRGGRHFPPTQGSVDSSTVVAAFTSHHYLLGLRKSPGYQGDEELAQAEHYCWARAMVILGGLPMYVVMVSETLSYDAVKQLLQHYGKLQWLKVLSPTVSVKTLSLSFDGKVTPSSAAQVAAGVEGAKAGLRIGSILF